MSQFFLLIPAFFLLFTGSADANVGIPMLIVVWPPLVLALIPVIYLEAVVLARRLEIAYKPAVKLSAVANCVSTIVGIPLVWIILVCIQMLVGGGAAWDALNTWHGRFIAGVLQSPWLIPYETELYWLIPTAMVSLYLIFFFASWGIETWVVKRMIKSRQRDSTLRKAVFWAQVASYAVLPIFVGIYYLIKGSYLSEILQYPVSIIAGLVYTLAGVLLRG